MIARAPTTVRLRAALLLVIVATSLLVATTWSVFSHTWDEPEHIAAGLALIDEFKYDYDIQHPPLGRLAMAIGPYLLGARSVGKAPPDGRPEGVAILYGEGHYHEYLTAARAGMLVFLWLMLYTTFLFARRVARSDGEALLGVAFLAATPAILGNAGLATLDVPSVATMVFALYALGRWLEQPGRGTTVLLGIAGGVAVATKLSAIPFLGLAGPTLALLQWRLGARATPGVAHPLRARALQVLAAAFIALVVVTLSYGGRFQYYTDASGRFNQALYFLFGKTGRAHDLAYAFAARVPMPEAWQKLLGGIQALEVHNSNGHLSYLLGETRLAGWWYFYFVALAVKTPLPLLALGLTGLVLAARDGVKERVPWRAAPLAVVVVLLLFVSLYSRINIGVRHVLILYPFFAIGAAYTCARSWALFRAPDPGSAWRRVAFPVAAVLALWLGVSLIRCYPDYLAYFNETVSHPERVLVDSDLDWGQDLFRLERRLAELNVKHFHFGYLGTADLAREPLAPLKLPPLTLLPPGQRATGWVAVSALARIYAHGGYDWLDAYTPVERIGKTIDLYYVPADGAADASHP